MTKLNLIRYSKGEVDYTPQAHNPKERCEVCQHFQEPNHCHLVAGEISPAGWCKEFEK